MLTVSMTRKQLRGLRQIVVLRKLRIPLKQIDRIFQDPQASTALEVLQENLRNLEEETASISAVREVLQKFVEALKEEHICRRQQCF